MFFFFYLFFIHDVSEMLHKHLKVRNSPSFYFILQHFWGKKTDEKVTKRRKNDVLESFLIANHVSSTNGP